MVKILSAIGNAALACWCFVVIAVSPGRRSRYGQQFLYKTEGETFERAFAAFGQSAAGPPLFEILPDSVGILRDRASMSGLSGGTLGRSYYDFMVNSGIDENLYLAGAVAAGLRFERDPRRRWFRTRVEAGHDLRHVLTGYGIDPLGETCLMVFRFGQTRHAGTFVIAALGFAVLAVCHQAGLVRSMREAYRRGQSALLLDLLPWEDLLKMSLADVQRTARLEPPLCYPAIPGRPDAIVRPLVKASA